MSDAHDELEIEIVQLRDLDLDGLRLRWRGEFGRAAPALLPKHLLFRLMAYRLQARAFGDLSREARRMLDGLARQKHRDEGFPDAGVAIPNSGKLKPGTLLVREHEGRPHHVMVTDEGFVWNGAAYPSLSKVAHAITGTRWNGPRFFGLRDAKREKC